MSVCVLHSFDHYLLISVLFGHLKIPVEGVAGFNAAAPTLLLFTLTPFDNGPPPTTICMILIGVGAGTGVVYVWLYHGLPLQPRSCLSG